MKPSAAAFTFSFSPAAVLRFFIALAAIVLAVAPQWLTPLNDSFFADEWLRDQFIRWHADTTPESRLVVVDIDEASLQSVGPWPWPRARIADLVEKLLSTYQARAVALDLVFPEPADAAGDARLAMLAQHGPVVLAQAFDYERQQLPVRVGRIGGGTPAGSAYGVPVATGFVGNHAGLAAQAAHLGNIGFRPDADGAIRYLPMLTRFEGRDYPTLSLALLDCCTGEPKMQAQLRHGWERIAFQRDWSAYTVVPAGDLLRDTVPANVLAGKLVLVGSSSLGLSDRVATPLAPSTSGVLVHASQLSALLDRQAGLAPAPWPGRWMAALFSVLVAVVAARTFPRLSAIANVSLLGGAAVLWLLLAYGITPHDPQLVTTAPLASILFLLAVAVPFDWQVTQSRSRRLLDTFRHYVAEAVVDELLRRGLKNPLAPRRLEVTTLIADMQGYTNQVEALSMEEAAQLTRDFLDCLTRPVLAHRGTLDKFTGDGLVAFWGAPLPVEDHADQAIDAAIKMVAEVRRFSEVRQQAGLQPLRVRIGIESGLAMAGDFGTSFRSIYTAVGDSVNVAARLEQAARNYPHDIVIGEGAASRATRHKFLFLGETLLRGKENPTKLYTLSPAEMEPAA
jgi:adenylate cyclase